ncbi:MAG TPA: hypothetical protein PKO15_16810 [Fibrobacteria bacterium]|nr:hypothetical protein [Fibrobacteria bacterium]HOX53151.1 hypothetical protein [Fibrobacteria bacterium]
MVFVFGAGCGVALLLGGTWISVQVGWTRAASRTDSVITASSDSVMAPEDRLRQEIRTRERILEWRRIDPVLGQAVDRVLADSGDGPFVSRMLDAGDWSRLRAPDGVPFAWSRTDIWDSTLQALRKDREAILMASRETGLSPRMVALPALCEQMRRAETFRDQYKRVFSKFIPTGNLSMGVTGIKPETLRRIVPWCDPRFLPWIDSVSDETIRKRLEDKDDHRWSYLYAATCLSAIRRKWLSEAGIDLAHRPEILLTVYNIGVHKCPPNREPQPGGAVFKLGGAEYTFGTFAWEFFWSGRALDELPF